jgi:hypothetical protein
MGAIQIPEHSNSCPRPFWARSTNDKAMKLVNCLVSLIFAGSVHAGLSEWQAAVTADNPRNWYRFDETAGTALVDHGPGGLNGTYEGVTINQPGLFGPGQAATFPGQSDGNDLVRFDTNTWANQTIAGDWTAEFIIYKAAAGQGFSQALFNGPATSVRLEQWNSFNDYGDYRGGVTQYGVADYYLEGTVAPPDEWSHMVFVRSGTQTFIYLNGVHRGSMANVVNLEMQTISRSSTSQFDKLNATLDEAVVYDRALTSAQVAAHFAATGIIPPVVAPTIAGQPQSQSVIIGTPNATVSFTVVATGTLPLEYQWSRNGEEIEGATEETLTLTEVTAADTGAYRVVVSNSGGSLTSAEAILSIAAPPFNEGNNQTVLSGFPATFSVTLEDIPGYQFEWKKNGSTIAGETGRSLVLASTAPADSGGYSLEISFGSDTVTVGPAQLIVPAVPTTSYGNRVSADNPLSYWRLNDPDQAPSIADERGLLNNSQYYLDVDYQLPGALLGDANAAVGFRGTATSKGEVFVNNELSTPQFSVELWAMRTGGAGVFTSPLTFRDLNDTAVPPYRKGWLFYATDANNWQFRIGDGTATWVIIDGPPVVDGEWTQLVGTYDGTRVAFFVNGALVESRIADYAPIDPAQLPPLLRIGGGSTEDETGSFFFTGRVDEVAVYNNALTPAEVADHWAAAFSPTLAPVIDLQPQSTDVAPGGTVTLTVAARSGTPVAYQWKKDGATLEGETSDTLVIAGAAGAEGNYTVDVTNAAGTTTSQAATLAVVGPEATYQATILRDGPVAYWRLGEADGTVAADVMGNHPGAYGVGITLGQSGALDGDVDTAAGFAVANQSFVEVPWSAELNPPQFTFECWAKVTGGTDYRSPMTSRADGPQKGFIFYATPGNAWEFWTGTGTGWNAVGGASVVNDTWVHLAGTHDGTTKRFFVNGQQVGANQSAFTPNDLNVLRIGAGATESPTGNYFFDGVVDEAAVYSKVLSPARILSHYLAGQPAVAEIVAEIALDGDEIVISWDGSATLEETDDIAGAWNNVAGASSPYRVTPGGTQKFWRLRNP